MKLGIPCKCIELWPIENFTCQSASCNQGQGNKGMGTPWAILLPLAISTPVWDGYDTSPDTLE